MSRARDVASNNLAVDTTPTLQGDLTMGSNSIADGVLGVKNTGSQSELRLYCESGNAHYVSLKAPAHSAFSGNHSITMPPNTGNNGEFLKTDGNGVTSWASAGGNAGWTWLARNNITSSTSYSTFDSSVITSTYDNYAIVANGINFGANDENIGFFVHANGAWQQGTGKNDYDHNGIKFNSATDNQNSILSGGGFNRTNVYMDTTGYGAGSQNTQYSTAFTLYMSTKAQNSKARNIWWYGSFNNSTSGTDSYGGSVTVGAASYDGELTNNITGIRFYGYSGNNFVNGTWDLYGLARS